MRLPLPILLAASLQAFSCILCTASIHEVAHYWFIYHMQDKVTLDLDLEITSVRSYDQISAAGKTMLYFNINLKKKKKGAVHRVGNILDSIIKIQELAFFSLHTSALMWPLKH